MRPEAFFMDRFNVKHPNDATRIEDRHAHFTGHTVHRENKISKFARIFDQTGLTGAGHVAHHAT